MEDSSFKGKDAQYIQGLKKKNEKTIEARPLDATRIPADCKLVAIANEVSRNQGCHRWPGQCGVHCQGLEEQSLPQNFQLLAFIQNVTHHFLVQSLPQSSQLLGFPPFFFKINSIQEPLNLALLRGQAKARQRKEGCGEGRSGQSKGKVEGKGCKAWNPGYLGLRRRGWWEWWGGGGASAWWWGRWWRWIPPYYPGGHGGWWVGRGLGRGGDMGSVWRMQLWLPGWGARQLIHVNGCINVASKCHVWAFVFPNTIRLQLTGHQKWCRGLEQIDHLGRPSRCAKMRDACMLNHVRLRTAMFVQQTKKIGYRMVQVWLSSKHGSNCQASECVSPAHCQRDGGRPFQKAFRR